MQKAIQLGLAAVFLSILGCSAETTTIEDGNGWDAVDHAPDAIVSDNEPGNDTPDSPLDLPVIEGEELCGEAEFNVLRVIPDVLILLDRSNSMSDSPPEPPLWDTIRDAIVTVTSGLDDSIWFGLMTFPNSTPPFACSGLSHQCQHPAPTAVLVEVGAGTSDAIKSGLASLATCGGTPIAMSLQSAQQYLLTLPDDHPKYILLATDGAPNCNAALDGSTCRCTGDNCAINNKNCLDDARTYDVLDTLCENGIDSYILGMGGATSWGDVFDAMADHGCTDTYYETEDPASIQGALEAITGTIASCRFELDCSEIPDPGKVNFYFDGNIVPMDPSSIDGWNWVVPCDGGAGTGVVEFYGTYCDMIKCGGVGTVSATFGCPTVLI